VTVSLAANNRVDITWSKGAGANSYQVLVDDSPYFRTPILSQPVSGNTLSVDAFQSGFAPGVTYYVQVMPTGTQTTFRLDVTLWPEALLTYSYARSAWEKSGRSWMTEFSGIAWDNAAGAWHVNNSWPDAQTLVAQDAYDMEAAARSALNIGAVKTDVPLLDELAAFYVAYENRFTTVGAMRAMTQYDTSRLEVDDDSAKTLIWVWPSGNITYVLECDLCNSQFYYPAARLLRIISTLPLSKRTPSMQAFAAWYAPVITQDHLLRLFWRPTSSVMQRVQASGRIYDEDLWLAAAAAEVLGANANDPVLTPLTSLQSSQLHQAVKTIVQALQNNNHTYYAGTQNFQKQVVGSVSYFNGQFTAPSNTDPDYKYSGYIGQAFPTPQNAAVDVNASWDISHFHRVPVFLRALYDNKKATALDFPSSDDIRLVTNHLLYQNFQGDFALPLFNNYFDGSNGWYRVGYHGPNFGYPPAQYCDSSADVTAGGYATPCLIAGAVQGWGSVAFLNSDLVELEHSLASLALSSDPAQIAFRNRYYYYAAQSYSSVDANGNLQYPILLFFVLSGTPEKLQ
jgi:ribosomal protein L31